MITVGPGDPLVDGYRDLKDSRARARLERDAGWFVAEGVETVRRVLASEVRVLSLFVLPRRAGPLEDEAARRSVPVFVADPQVYNATVGFDAHRGVLALCDRPPAPSLAEVVTRASLLAVVEGVGDAENLGALVRSAAAFGVDGIVLDPSCADPWVRRTVRVSMGHVVGAPIVRTGDWPASLDEMRRAGLAVVALTPSGDHDLATWRPPARTAVLVGAEGAGLSEAALAAADVRVRIPMASGVDSLNVAAASAVALHHIRSARS